MPLCFCEGDESMTCEFDDFGFRASQQQSLHHVRSHQGMNGRCINWLCLSQLNIGVFCFRWICVQIAQFNCTGLVACLMVCLISLTGASSPVKSLY